MRLWTRLAAMITLLFTIAVANVEAANTVHVAAGGGFSGDYETLNAAFAAASGKTNPVITLTNHTTFTSTYAYNPGSGWKGTLDLNNFTITTTGTPTDLYLFRLTSGKLTITDNSAEGGGVWNMAVEYASTLIGINPIGGEVVLAGGKVYVYNTASGKTTYGVQTESSGVYTQTDGVLEAYGTNWVFGVSIKKSATISGGTLQATSSKGASGIACYFWATSPTLSVSGGRLISDKILGNPTNASSLSITGGCFSNLNTYNWSTGVTTANLADYVDASTYDILTLTSDNPEYAKGSRYMVAPKGTTVQVYTTEGTTGFTTLNAAFNYAKAKKAPLITLIDNTTYTIPYASYQPTVSDWRGTLDLNNKTITTSGSVDNNFIFRINKSDMKLTITDNSAEGGGVWNLTAPYSSGLNGIDIYSGELELAGGKLQIDNTTSGQSLYGIKTETAGTYTQTGGILDVTRSVSGGTYGLGIVGNVTISGGKINAPNGYATIFFNYAKTLTISGGKFIVGTGGGFILGYTERATSIALTGGYYSNLRAYISGAVGSITTYMDASTYQTFDVTSNPEYTEGCRYLIAPKTATVEVKHDAGIAYCATLNAAFDEAKSKSNPVMTLIANTTFTGQYILTPTIADWRGTLDLNNKTVTTASTSASIIFYVNKSDMKLTVTDSSSGGNGAWNSEVSWSGTLTAIRVEKGELILAGGKLHATNSAADKAIYGVTAAATGTYTQTAGVNEVVNPTGGSAYATGVFGTVNISGGTVSASSGNTESDAFIFLGTAGAGTQKLTLSGGKFKAGTYIANYAERASVFDVTGGYFSTCTIHKTSPSATDVNLDTYCVSPNHPVLMSTAESSPLGMPNNSYKVVSAHSLTWDLNGGTVSGAGSAGGCVFPAVGATGTPSRYVADGASISAPTVTKEGYDFDIWSPYPIATMPAANTTYTATWTPATLTFTGATTLWSTPSNWSPACVPTLNHDVIIQKPCSVDIAHALAKSIVIYNNGSDKTGKLSVGANKGLEVTGTIRKTTNGSSYGPTAPEDLVLESAAAGNASLIFNNSNGCQATVYMYSKATNSSAWNWQYIGTPFTGSKAFPNYMGSWLYRWKDDCSGWEAVSNDDNIDAFTGYCLTQSSAKVLEMTGTLNASSSQNITVPAGKERVVANSWTGPIYIRQLRDADFGSMGKTVYLFNTGNDPNGEGTVDRNADAAGTYRAIPIHAASYLNDSVISSMQGFYVRNASGSAQTLTLSYADHVRPARTTDAILNGSMRARKEELAPEVMKITVQGSRYGTDLYLLSRKDFSRGYEDGWDGENINKADAAPLLYSLREDGTKDAVSAIPDFEGTVVGFQTGEDSEYTFSFTYNGDEAWYLNDLLTETSTLISAETTYTFATTDDDAVRFVISATPLAKTPQGIESIQDSEVSVQKVLICDELHIIRNGKIYDATGKLVHNK